MSCDLASALFDTRIYTKRNRLSKCVLRVYNLTKYMLSTQAPNLTYFPHIKKYISSSYRDIYRHYLSEQFSEFSEFFFHSKCLEWSISMLYKCLCKIWKSNIEWEASYITTIYALKTYTCLYRFVLFSSLRAKW